MPITEIPIENLSFRAYRLVGPDGLRQEEAMFLSLAHWFEAEKFRAFAKDLYLEVLHSPSAKEARNLAKRNQPSWRGDWMAVKVRALACGMVYAAAADGNASRWQGDEASIAKLLAPLGQPERLNAAAASEYIRLRDAARISFLGGGAATPEFVGKRVHAVHRKAQSAWRLTHWLGRHGSWQIHDWAVQQFVPVAYAGATSSRLGPKGLEILQAQLDHVVVFEERGGKAMDGVIRGLRSLKVPVELDLFKIEGVTGDLAG